jgi:transposase
MAKHLQSIIRQTKDAYQLRRALAIYWLDEGRSVPEIAGWLQVNSATIYRWADLYDKRIGMSVEDRLAKFRRGCPRKRQGEGEG